MDLLKYHVLTATSAVVFSFVSALTVNQFVRFTLEESAYPQAVRRKSGQKKHAAQKNFGDYERLIRNSGFFSIADTEQEQGPVSDPQRIDIYDLKLLGTISGPPSIARALVLKKGEREPVIYKRREDVFGYRLKTILPGSIVLLAGKNKEVIDIYDERSWKGQRNRRRSTAARQARNISKRISRAELKQRVLNSVDNALKGLRAGPYREGGRVAGYRLIKVRPYNILYKLGMRSGDIVRRINGHIISGTEKLYSLWKSLEDNSRITVDVVRRGKNISYDFTIVP